MPATPIYALPYPALSDTADVPRDIQALATKLDAGLGPKVVTSLPGSPVDGQEVYYQADATAGVFWHLRYRSGATGSYKWEFVGGAPLSNEWLASEGLSVSANVWAALTVNDPKVTVPLAGDYDVQHVTSIQLASNGTVAIGLRIGATDPIASTNSANSWVAAATWTSVTQRRRLTAVAAATVIAQRYFHAAAAPAVLTRISAALAIWPVRVG